MKPDCLTDRDLILLHYGEAPDRTTPAAAAAHLAVCEACRLRSARLANALARIPAAVDPDPAVATRIAARVNERLGRRRRWLPLAGATAATAVALGMAVAVWRPSPGNQPPPASPQITSLQSPVVSGEELFVGPPRPASRQATLDIDLLEKLDLLEELETLRAIEGV